MSKRVARSEESERPGLVVPIGTTASPLEPSGPLPMSMLGVVLSVLSREELIDLCRDVDVGPGRSVTITNMRAAIEANPEVTLEAVVETLTVDALRRALLALGLPTHGYIKQALSQRILSSAAAVGSRERA